MTLHRSLIAAAAAAALLLPAVAAAQDVVLTGQVRPRLELRDPDFPAAPAGDVTMRVRLGAVANLPERIGLRIDVQDVLIWGTAIGGPASSAEIHQAFIDIGDLFAAGLTARLGRQEIVLGNERLVGNNNWNQRGRKFDGGRLLVESTNGHGSVIATRTSDTGPFGGVDAWLHGAHVALPFAGRDSLSFHLLYDRWNNGVRTNQFTFGGHGSVDAGALALIAEGYLQRGTRLGTDASAYMFAAGAATAVERARFRLMYEHYSGDADLADGTIRAFERPFGSFHGFHGYADVFTDIAFSTGGRGLRDLNLRASFLPNPRTEVRLHGHFFGATARGPLTSSRFGEEVDLVVIHRPRQVLALEGGLSWFSAGPAIEQVRGLDRDLAFGYAMITVAF